MNKDKKTEDLFEFRLSDDTWVNAWTDGEITFFSLRFVTLAIPNELFNELIKALSRYTGVEEDKRRINGVV